MLLWIFYLLVTGQLPQFIAFATRHSGAQGNQPAGNTLPTLPSLPGSTGGSLLNGTNTGG